MDAGILIPNSTEIYEPYEYGMDAGVFVKNGNFANVRIIYENYVFTLLLNYLFFFDIFFSGDFWR